MIREHKLDISKINGTGKDGRITKEDVLNHMSGASHKTQKSQDHQHKDHKDHHHKEAKKDTHHKEAKEAKPAPAQFHRPASRYSFPSL
jgi:pyruvate/2-oxoglutarate dehydrogenase complex dihydrolipoamide acyltransferase (E2) component